MAYNYITNRDSPNYTPNASVGAVFGYPRQIEGITIHWWGDPAQNPSFEGIVNYLCRAGGNSSAHFVATGTNRQVACIVSPADAAWHAGSSWGNARTIGIEVDPRGRAEDFDVVAELIADLRSAYGDVPLYWHSYFTPTQCPGVYRDAIERLDALSYTKYSHATEWGKGGNKTSPAPAPAPTPTPVPTPVTPPAIVETKKTTYEIPKTFKITAATTLANIPDGSAYNKTVYKIGDEIKDVVELFEYSNGAKFYRTKYARDSAKKMYGFPAGSLVEIVPPKPAPEVVIPSPTTQTPDGNPLPDTGKPITEKDGYTEEDRTRDNAMLVIVQEILKLLKSVWGSLTSLHKKIK